MSVVVESDSVVVNTFSVDAVTLTVSSSISLMTSSSSSAASSISSPSFYYQRVSIASYASAGIARAEMSVRPSVRLSHSGIVSKRRKLAS